MRRVTPGASHRFVAATDQLETGTPVVSVMGEVDLATAPALEQTLLGVDEDRADELIVDLSGCSYLDSSGLKALLATLNRTQSAGRRRTLVVSNPNVMRIFRLTRFDELFDIYPTIDAAVNGSTNAK